MKVELAKRNFDDELDKSWKMQKLSYHNMNYRENLASFLWSNHCLKSPKKRKKSTRRSQRKKMTMDQRSLMMILNKSSKKSRPNRWPCYLQIHNYHKMQTRLMLRSQNQNKINRKSPSQQQHQRQQQQQSNHQSKQNQVQTPKTFLMLLTTVKRHRHRRKLKRVLWSRWRIWMKWAPKRPPRLIRRSSAPPKAMPWLPATINLKEARTHNKPQAKTRSNSKNQRNLLLAKQQQKLRIKVRGNRPPKKRSRLLTKKKRLLTRLSL